jgi:hypothetical protein
LNIDIDGERYQEEGSSKAKRVRSLLKQVDSEIALRVLRALLQYKIESLPEQVYQSRNDYLALISWLENSEADAAKGAKPGTELTIAEMDKMKKLAPYPRGLRFQTWFAELCSVSLRSAAGVLF